MSKLIKCVICNRNIPPERLAALKMLGVESNNATHVGCSQETKRQGIFLGESGTSQLLIVRKVYDDSVREVFKGSPQESDDPE